MEKEEREVGYFPGKTFKHYKGGIYSYKTTAKSKHDNKDYIIYIDENDTVWSREKEEFEGYVSEGVPRFESYNPSAEEMIQSLTDSFNRSNKNLENIFLEVNEEGDPKKGSLEEWRLAILHILDTIYQGEK